MGKRALESLIKAGALDGFGRARGAAGGARPAAGLQRRASPAPRRGQLTLFGAALPPEDQATFEPLPDVPGDRKEELAWEKELIGLYLSEHPLHQVAEHMADSVTTLIGDIEAGPGRASR